MEWGNLLPEDRRTLKALLGLNDDGTRRELDGAPSPVTTTDAAPALVVPVEPPKLTVSQLKHGIESQVAQVAKHWTVVRQVRRSYGKAIRIADCQSTIRTIMDTVHFKGFLVVYAQVTFSVVPWCAPKKQPRAEELTNEKGSRETVVHSASARCPLARVTVHTMQFVHRDDVEHGFEVQSVVLPGEPLALQCVAGIMVQFGLLCFLRLNYHGLPTVASNGETRMWDVSRLRGPSSGTVLVLGMGGNVMANCVLRLVPPSVSVHVVEIEPSVVATCTLEGLLPLDAANFSCEIGDVAKVMSTREEGSCAIIFLDCFDPVAQDMLTARDLLSCARMLLRRPDGPSVDSTSIDMAAVTEGWSEGGLGSTVGGVGSVLVVNLHQRPSRASLQVFFDVFGADCVEVVDLFQSRQCFVACSVLPFVKIDVPQLHSLIQTVNENNTLVWSGGSEGAKMAFDENTVTVKRLITHTTGSATHWVAADDTR